MNKVEAFNKTYREVLEHRKNCPFWGEDFCLECFGGGLTNFTATVNARTAKSGEEFVGRCMFGPWTKHGKERKEEKR